MVRVGGRHIELAVGEHNRRHRVEIMIEDDPRVQQQTRRDGGLFLNAMATPIRCSNPTIRLDSSKDITKTSETNVTTIRKFV